MNELELVDTRDLVAELQKRFCNLVLMANKEMRGPIHETVCIWSGGILSCLGLVQLLQAEILDDYRESCSNSEGA